MFCLYFFIDIHKIFFPSNKLNTMNLGIDDPNEDTFCIFDNNPYAIFVNCSQKNKPPTIYV